jgi:hypothetical protein
VAPLDERQQRIADWLDEKTPDLASMYQAAIRQMSERPDAGDERTRVAYICHSMREVMNRVPDVTGTTAIIRIKPSSDDQVQELPNLLTQHPELSLEDESDSVLIPREVASTFGKLIKTVVNEKQRSRDIVASVLTDDGNTEAHAVKLWVDSRRFFVKWAHLHDQRDAPRKLPNDDEIRGHLAVFEELFDGVIAAFFSLRHQIDSLLVEFNAEVEDDSDG